MRSAQRIAQVAAILAVVGAAAALGWGIVVLISRIFEYVAGVPKEIGVALIAGVTAVIASTITVVAGRYFERKKELIALHREKKVEVYDEFLKTFLSLFQDSTAHTSETLVPFLRDLTRKLVLWSGPQVVLGFVKWKKHLTKGIPDAQTLFLTEQFLLAIRRDLGHSNRGIPKGFFAYLILKEPELFLAAARKQPGITLNEIAAIEKAMKAASSDHES
jgi:hypothetical protein